VTALAATGLIWSRYATQITPVNYNLLSVNVFVAMTGCYQLYRIYQYKQQQQQEQQLKQAVSSGQPAKKDAKPSERPT
jgi:hypothetical protein